MVMIKYILIAFILTGCSAQVGTHYAIKYEGIEVEVDDYTDREGVEFEYTTPNGTTIKLKKSTVDTTTPAEIIGVIDAQKEAAYLRILEQWVKP